MKNLDKLNLGIYEKALPKDIDWVERIKLVKECGYDMEVIRVCEISLFLSMLPLHIDIPSKVFAFILNAINMMKELDKNGK